MKKFITVINEDRDVSFTSEESVLKLLLKNKIDIDTSCEGMGTCGTCRIFVESDIRSLPKRTEIEQERANDLHFKENERLACQLCPLDGMKISIP